MLVVDGLWPQTGCTGLGYTTSGCIRSIASILTPFYSNWYFYYYRYCSFYYSSSPIFYHFLFFSLYSLSFSSICFVL